MAESHRDAGGPAPGRTSDTPDQLPRGQTTTLQFLPHGHVGDNPVLADPPTVRHLTLTPTAAPAHSGVDGVGDPLAAVEAPHGPHDLIHDGPRPNAGAAAGPDASPPSPPPPVAPAADAVPPAAATPNDDPPAEPPPWGERIAIAAASRFAALLPCPASGDDKSAPCEHVDLVLPPDVVQPHGPDTLRVELTVRITGSPTKAPSRSAAVNVSGCRTPDRRLQRLVLHVSRSDTGVVVDLEGERDAAAEPTERQ